MPPSSLNPSISSERHVRGDPWLRPGLWTRIDSFQKRILFRSTRRDLMVKSDMGTRLYGIVTSH